MGTTLKELEIAVTNQPKVCRYLEIIAGDNTDCSDEEEELFTAANSVLDKLKDDLLVARKEFEICNANLR